MPRISLIGAGTAPASGLEGHSSAGRRFEWVELPAAKVRASARAHRVSSSVVLLAVVAEALHRRGHSFDLAFVGPHTPYSRRLFAGRARPWLHVVGPVDRQTKWDALEAATVMCLPSAQEAFGRVYLEAWSCSKPVIGGRIPSVSEVITDAENGLLVDPGSVAELEQALERVLTDPGLAARIGEAGRQERERRFTWTQVVARVERVYEGLLAAQPIAGRPT